MYALKPPSYILSSSITELKRNTTNTVYHNDYIIIPSILSETKSLFLFIDTNCNMQKISKMETLNVINKLISRETTTINERMSKLSLDNLRCFTTVANIYVLGKLNAFFIYDTILFSKTSLKMIYGANFNHVRLMYRDLLIYMQMNVNNLNSAEQFY